jgi:hypothetical protein
MEAGFRVIRIKVSNLWRIRRCREGGEQSELPRSHTACAHTLVLTLVAYKS